MARRVFNQGERLAGASQFLAADIIGSVEAVTQDDGSLLARYAFDPYGRQTVVAGTAVSGAGFAGHRRAILNQLSQTQYRFLDSTAGRWISEDPAGFVDGPNLYAYVGNNPTSRTDTSGLQRGAVLTWLWKKFVGPEPIEEGIKRTWISCQAGSLIFSENPQIDPIAQSQEYGQVRDDFYKRCSAGEGERRLRHVESMPFTYGGVNNSRLLLCCETCQ